MPWSEAIIEQFAIVDFDTTEERDFYGPFNSLLVDIFPSSEHYQVSPQPKLNDGTLDLAVQFIVYHRATPIFFLDIKAFRSLTLSSTRASADDQMRQTFRHFSSATIPSATFYGLSAFGPQFCVYSLDTVTRSIDPPGVARDLTIVNDIAPENRWAYNLFEPSGEAKLREVVNAVKEMTKNCDNS
ncbi:hypothetical protein JR316_0006003 [Psilocybe cubensis]|uniref:Uncharacterized protein n=2 Tax=Psilocybe cubensis TaxID=181762 RepID=A0ACB8H0T5_PSICU|nr:hypothetical protein JR316_0006003 [Psilocybe cubensis]KAH9481476.1 hypothetical protein JR316_0006003 [Psilocybe cubensis]